MATVEFRDEKFLFAPDVQGPMSTGTLELILEEKPQLAMIGGPPLYLEGFKVDEGQIKTSLRNLEKVVENVPCVIVEHHILRDESWHEKTVNAFYSAYKTGNTLQTAAEFLGKENTFLEAMRKKLYTENPPPKEFEAWMRITEEKKKHRKPPI
jgi:predicted metallo-beta-lactamase superfamily hydrolase